MKIKRSGLRRVVRLFVLVGVLAGVGGCDYLAEEGAETGGKTEEHPQSLDAFVTVQVGDGSSQPAHYIEDVLATISFEMLDEGGSSLYGTAQNDQCRTDNTGWCICTFRYTARYDVEERTYVGTVKLTATARFEEYSGAQTRRIPPNTNEVWLRLILSPD